MTLDHEDIAAIAAEVARLLSGAGLSQEFNTPVPIDLREAAELCHVELLWLRERVARKEIPAYRNGPRGSWKVFPKDVRAYVMASNNQAPQRRKSVLKIVA